MLKRNIKKTVNNHPCYAVSNEKMTPVKQMKIITNSHLARAPLQ